MNSVHHEISEVETEVLTAFRRELSPTEAERSQTFERAMIGLAEGVQSDGGGISESPHRPSAGLKRFNALQLAGAAILSFGLGVGAHAGLASTRRAQVDRPNESVLSVETSVPKARLPLSPPPHIEGVPAPGPAPVNPPRPSSFKGRKSEVPSAALYREMDRVRQAQTALSQGQPLGAIGILSELDKEQPNGALGAERSMITILSLCQLGRSEEAERRVRLNFSKGIQGDYRARLEASCAKNALGGVAK